MKNVQKELEDTREQDEKIAKDRLWKKWLWKWMQKLRELYGDDYDPTKEDINEDVVPSSEEERSESPAEDDQ